MLLHGGGAGAPFFEAERSTVAEGTGMRVSELLVIVRYFNFESERKRPRRFTSDPSQPRYCYLRTSRHTSTVSYRGKYATVDGGSCSSRAICG